MWAKLQQFLKIRRWRIIIFICGVCLIIFGSSLLVFESWGRETISAQETCLESQAEIAPQEEILLEELIVVDIGGAVEKPGIYRLNEDARLADLVETAGGFVKGKVDRYLLQRQVNLALVLKDGGKYYIPYEGETETSQVVTAEGFELSESGSGLISINQADYKTLMSLPSIGEVRAQAIIDGRPYESLDDLAAKQIISSKILENIRALIEL